MDVGEGLLSSYQAMDVGSCSANQASRHSAFGNNLTTHTVVFYGGLCGNDLFLIMSQPAASQAHSQARWARRVLGQNENVVMTTGLRIVLDG